MQPLYYDEMPPLDEVERILERTSPGLMRMLYPRRYENIGGWHSPRMVSLFAAVQVATLMAPSPALGGKPPASAVLMYPLLEYMARRGMPYMFLGRDFAKAVMLSAFDEELDWAEMPLPYECGAFILQPGTLVHEKDGEVAAIFYGRVPKGECPPFYPGLAPMDVPVTSFVTVALCPDAENGPVWYDTILSEDYSTKTRIGNVFLRKDLEEFPVIEPDSPLDAKLMPEDVPFLERMSALLFGVLVAMTLRPALVESGTLLRTVKAKRPGEGVREFWSPNYVGRFYRIRREALGGTHASPRPHWRRGHFRMQAVGPAHSQRKRVWIEPCFVCPAGGAP